MLDLGVCLGGFLPHQMGKLGEAADLKAPICRPFDDDPAAEELFARFGSPGSRRDEVVELPKRRISFRRAFAVVAGRLPDGVGQQLQGLFTGTWHIKLPFKFGKELLRPLAE